jgi:glucosamine-6-phosphate deaminase
MKINIYATKGEMAKHAAETGANAIRAALRDKGEANIIVATGASQFEVLAELVKATDIDWSKIRSFHLDEYVGLPIQHPASFRRYLWERFVSKLPLPLNEFYYLDGCADLEKECERVGRALRQNDIEVAFVGIGENGHLAFNDPPADFETNEPYIVVDLDEACRKQQFGEGWFKTLNDVPLQAISMSVRQIMKSRTIVCTVPDERKAQAVKNSTERAVSPLTPASILQEHENTELFLDQASASMLDSSFAVAGSK